MQYQISTLEKSLCHIRQWVTEWWAARYIALSKALLVAVILSLSLPAHASSISIPYVFSPNTTIVSAQVNANFSTIAGVVNGNLDQSNLAAGANIPYTKLNNTGTLLNLQAVSTVLGVGVGEAGDTQPRVGLYPTGAIEFGPGTATAPNVGLQWEATNTLQLFVPGGGTPILDLGGGSVSVPDIQGLRLTISSTLPVAADGTSTTLYCLPFRSGYIALYNANSVWVTDVVTSLSISMPATTSTLYDVYVYDNSGVATIGLAAWSGSTPPTRGNQNGVPFTNNNKVDRWIGTLATNGTSGTTEDDASARLVWNYNNQLPRPLYAQIPVATWTYNSATVRASDANTTVGQGRFQFVTGLANTSVDATFMCSSQAGASTGTGNGIGINSTTAYYNSNYVINSLNSGEVSSPLCMQQACRVTAVLSAPGLQYVQMLEHDTTGTAGTFVGNSGTTQGFSWLQGTVMN